MIVVKIEYWPFGDKKRKKEIGEMRIQNNLTGTESVGSYDVEIAPAKDIREHGKCTHERSKSVFHLVLAALKACVE